MRLFWCVLPLWVRNAARFVNVILRLARLLGGRGCGRAVVRAWANIYIIDAKRAVLLLKCNDDEEKTLNLPNVD
jgi:hypothetical protein